MACHENQHWDYKDHQDHQDRQGHHLLRLPQTLATWPWSRSLNPSYASVARESAAWLRGFRAFPEPVQAAFDACDFGLLASLAFPRLRRDQLRICCDVMNVFFVVEEYTDEASPEVTAAVAAVVKDALRHPHDAPPTPPPAGDEHHSLAVAREIVRQFWANAVRIASPGTQARFVAAFEAYLDSVVEEAADRTGSTRHSVASYLQLRRRTIGCWPSFALLALCQDDDGTDDAAMEAALQHPLAVALGRLATDMILLGNDLVSYNKERPSGAVHNLVTVVLQTQQSQRRRPSTSGPSVQAAVDWVAAYHDELAQQFCALHEVVQLAAAAAGPSTGGPTVAALFTYANDLGNWVRANDQWSFESPRYFGRLGREVQMTRHVVLAAVEDGLPAAGGGGVDEGPRSVGPREAKNGGWQTEMDSHLRFGLYADSV